MNTQRLFNLITSDLTIDKLKFEQDLERTINADIEIDMKLKKIKQYLREISLIDLSLNTFVNMINNEEKNTNNDGQI